MANTVLQKEQLPALTQVDVGLGNVNNTSDAQKPVSVAAQAALNLKANSSSPTFTGTVSGINAVMVGLGNVNNTSDILKPVSTLQQNALDGKITTISSLLTTADLTSSGLESSEFISTNAIGFGALLFLPTGNVGYQLANAANATKQNALVMSVEAGQASSRRVLLYGYVRNDAWNWTTGSALYLSTTNGLLTQSAPAATGNIVKIVGYAVAATKILFCPDNQSIEIA